MPSSVFFRSSWRHVVDASLPPQPPRCFYAMFEKEQAEGSKKATKKTVEVTDYPMGSALLCSLMPRVLEAVHATPVLQKKLFQVNFLTTLSGEARTRGALLRPLSCGRRSFLACALLDRFSSIRCATRKLPFCSLATFILGAPAHALLSQHFSLLSVRLFVSQLRRLSPWFTTLSWASPGRPLLWTLRRSSTCGHGHGVPHNGRPHNLHRRP